MKCSNRIDSTRSRQEKDSVFFVLFQKWWYPVLKTWNQQQSIWKDLIWCWRGILLVVFTAFAMWMKKNKLRVKLQV